MAPSADACCICLHVFFGRQSRFRCVKCCHRVHQSCLMLAAEDLHLLRSGVSPFLCNHCDGSLPTSPNEGDVRASEKSGSGEQRVGDNDAVMGTLLLKNCNDDGDDQREGRSPSPIPSCTAGAASQRRDLEPSQQLPHGLLVDALEGISFLTDQENKRLRSEWTRSSEQQALLICSLRDEVKA
ncbi:unnamed protein product, partial [Ixodes hexagonus]